MNEIESLKVFELMEGLREHCFVELSCAPAMNGRNNHWECVIRPDSMHSGYTGHGSTPLEALTQAIAAFPPGVVT